MIVVTDFLAILYQMELHLVQIRKKNCHDDHIPFNLKGNGNIVFSVQAEKYIAISLAAVRETDVSQYQGGLIEAPLVPLEHCGSKASRGALNWAPIMTRCGSLSCRRCEIFLSRHRKIYIRKTSGLN